MTARGHTAFRPWVAVVAGVVVGVGLATTVTLLWPSLIGGPAGPGRSRAGPESAVALFQLSEPSRELLVVRSGPDASGEPALAKGLFPDATVEREIASVLLLNLGTEGPWDVDLATSPLQGRAGADAPWEDLRPVETAAGSGLDPSLAVRFRALAGTGPRVRVEPGSVRRLLVALPEGRTMETLSDVQWEGRPLELRRLDLESLHALREHGDERARPDLRRR